MKKVSICKFIISAFMPMARVGEGMLQVENENDADGV